MQSSYVDTVVLGPTLPRADGAPRGLRVLGQSEQTWWQRGKEWSRSSLRSLASGAAHPFEAWLVAQLRSKVALSPDGVALAVVAQSGSVSFRFADDDFMIATRCALDERAKGRGEDMDARARCIAWSDAPSGLLALSCAPLGDAARVVVVDAIAARTACVIPFDPASVAQFTHPLWIALRKRRSAVRGPMGFETHELLALCWSGTLVRARIAPRAAGDADPATTSPPHRIVDLRALTACRAIGAAALSPQDSTLLAVCGQLRRPSASERAAGVSLSLALVRLSDGGGPGPGAGASTGADGGPAAGASGATLVNCASFPRAAPPADVEAAARAPQRSACARLGARSAALCCGGDTAVGLGGEFIL